MNIWQYLVYHFIVLTEYAAEHTFAFMVICFLFWAICVNVWQQWERIRNDFNDIDVKNLRMINYVTMVVSVLLVSASHLFSSDQVFSVWQVAFAVPAILYLSNYLPDKNNIGYLWRFVYAIAIISYVLLGIGFYLFF